MSSVDSCSLCRKQRSLIEKVWFGSVMSLYYLLQYLKKTVVFETIFFKSWKLIKFSIFQKLNLFLCPFVEQWIVHPWLQLGVKCMPLFLKYFFYCSIPYFQCKCYFWLNNICCLPATSESGDPCISLFLSVMIHSQVYSNKPGVWGDGQWYLTLPDGRIQTTGSETMLSRTTLHAHYIDGMWKVLYWSLMCTNQITTFMLTFSMWPVLGGLCRHFWGCCEWQKVS